ncbi:MAG TPA: hypothetical protein VGV60_04410 [Candidatus Polarisedimenticolia bacterium]|jgi:hypothetical protein|nr:hypothetical protein [Candidatus Polarisedimenticolia bacterium]
MTRRLVLVAVLALVPAAPPGAQEARYYREGRFLVHEITGLLRDPAPRVRVETDLGSVSAVGAATPELRYRIRVRARGADDAATRRLLDDLQVSAAVNGDRLLFLGQAVAPGAGRDLIAEFEIELPGQVKEFEVATGAGDVRARGLPGRAELQTRGGNITVDRLGGPLRAETRGGNIEVGAAGGTARLITAGGSVRLESAAGEVVAQTSGGDVFIGRAGTQVRAESGGGNVTVESAGGDVSAQTRGGSIGIGDVRGEVIAVTAGGSIRVASARGGVRCESGAGPIFLKVFDGPIRAVTSAGNIQAEILPAGRTLFDSDIQTWQGDVLLTLPESSRVAIRAIVDNSKGRRIQSEFPLRAYREAEDAGRPVEIAEGALGGGGALIKIRTLDGNIVIQKASKSQP